MYVNNLKAWELPHGLLLFVAGTFTIATIIILFPFAELLYEGLLKFITDVTIYSPSSNIVSKIILGIFVVVTSLFLNTLIGIHWILNSLVLIYVWGVSFWIAVPIMAIKDITIILVVLQVDIQIWWLKKRLNYITHEHVFVETADEIKNEITGVLKNINEKSEAHRALRFIIQYIDLSLEFVLEKKCENPAMFMGELKEINSRVFLKKEMASLKEKLLLFVTTFEFEHFVNMERRNSRFSNTIFK